MLKAFHKETGEFISSFAIQRNIKWKGKEKDLFIAPKPEVFNWKELKERGIEEVEVSFIKLHKRNYDGKEIQVFPHFRIKTEHALANPLNESEEHLLSKEGIYEAIFNKELIINGKNIEEFNFKDVDIEVKLSPSKKSKIADVFCEFEESHPLFGRGIVFEIQFSYQNEERTEERTYERVLEGCSVCWMWEGDFDKHNKLKNNSLEVLPYLKAMKEYSNKIKNDLQKDLIIFMQHYEKQKEEIHNLKKDISEEVRYFFKKIDKNYDEIKLEIRNQFEKELKDILKTQINFKEISQLIKKEIDTSLIIKEVVNDIVNVGYSRVKCMFCNSWNCVVYPDKIQCFDCKKRWRNEKEIH